MYNGKDLGLGRAPADAGQVASDRPRNVFEQASESLEYALNVTYCFLSYSVCGCVLESVGVMQWIAMTALHVPSGRCFEVRGGMISLQHRIEK